MRIIFAGTPEFAAKTLKALLTTEHQICAVYTQPDRPSGRGRKLTASPVKQLAQSHQIPVEQPTNFKDEESYSTLASYQADLMIVVAYGLILPQRILDIPTKGCINIHASLLPRWRGAAPIQRAIYAGDKETGVCIMKMEAGLDTGPVLTHARCSILPEDTAQTLHDRLASLGGEILLASLTEIEHGKAIASHQDDSLANYAEKIHKSEATIDWSKPAETIARQIQAFNPWPVAQTTWQGKTFRIWLATAVPMAIDSPIGTIIAINKGSIDVATGEGMLRLQQVQIPGKRAMPLNKYLQREVLLHVL